jgi:hypothetical protein
MQEDYSFEEEKLFLSFIKYIKIFKIKEIWNFFIY